jgi:methylmalonyl-CoA mutase, N-terminal domain
MMEPKSEAGIKYEATPPLDIEPPAGEFPYRSGIHEQMYQSKPWTIRQYSGFGAPEDANARLKSLIASGVTGLSIAFDLPTQMGLDPSHELAKSEVGKVGVSVSSLDDMRRLFEGIDISKISTSMTINATAPILMLMYQILAEERGVPTNELRGTIQNDILKEYIARGTQIFPPSKSLDLTVETIIHCNRYLPNWNSISISGYHMSEAGATAVQEVAFTFANAIAYLRALEAKGMKVDEIAPRLSFFFASKLTFLEEIAKFRAAREVWAKIMRDEFGASNPKSHALRFHAQTAGVELIAQNPELNIVRVTLQSLGALFGGTQSLHTNSYDEAIGLPSEISSRIALQTQQIIKEETDLTYSPDPFRGSFLIENMTNQIVTEIKKELKKIEGLGGAVRCIQLGYQEEQIELNAFDLAQKIEDGSRKVVGLNMGDLDLESNSTILLANHFIKPHADINRRSKPGRNEDKLEKSLGALRESLLENLELLPQMKECILAGATIGEICRELSDVWGTAKN